MKSLIDILNNIINENYVNKKLTLYHHADGKSTLNSFMINEKLTLNNQSQLKETPAKSNNSSGLRDLSKIRNIYHITNCFNNVFSNNLAAHIDKMKYYSNKGSKPQTLVNTIKHPDKLIIRFTISVLMGLNEYANAFRNAIINRNIATADEIDKFILTLYNDDISYTYGAGFPQSMQKSLKPNIEKYLNKYNIKY